MIRFVSRVKTVTLAVLLLFHLIVFTYLATYNLKLVSSYCPRFYDEFATCLLLLFATLAQVMALKSMRYYCLTVLYVTGMALIIYDRFSLIENYVHYQFSESELDFFDSFEAKLYTIGECVIALKISTGILANIILIGYATLAVHSLYAAWFWLIS